jgi:hypothetical protein
MVLTSAERFIHSAIACRVVLDIRGEVLNSNRRIDLDRLPGLLGTRPRPIIIPDSQALDIIDISERRRAFSGDV